MCVFDPTDATYLHGSSPTLFLLKSSYHHITPEFWQPVDKERPVAVIRLVLERPCRVSGSVTLEPFAFFILCAKPRFLCTFQDRRDLADRETAFLSGLLALGRDDLGVRGDE